MNQISDQGVLIEVCVDSVASAIAAQHGGAARIELCANLLEGGVTPSAGMIEAVRRNISIGLQVMIRPRGGDFCYGEDEIEVMTRDIAIAKSLGADGLVLGILDTDGNVDVPRTRELVKLARPLNVTFHRAFDMSADLSRSLKDLFGTGVDRLLTSGGEQTALEGVETLGELVHSSRGRISIMAGGGINHSQVGEIIARSGVREIHAGLGSPVASPLVHRNPRVSMGKAQGREYQRQQVLEESVRKLREAVLASNHSRHS